MTDKQRWLLALLAAYGNETEILMKKDRVYMTTEGNAIWVMKCSKKTLRLPRMAITNLIDLIMCQKKGFVLPFIL